MQNEKHYILTFAWPIAKKLDEVMISDEVSIDHAVTRDHKSNKLSYVPLSENLWLTELLIWINTMIRMVADDKEPPTKIDLTILVITLNSHMAKCPRDEQKTLYLFSQNLLLSNLRNSWLLRSVLHMLLWGSKKVIPLLKFSLKINYVLKSWFKN